MKKLLIVLIIFCSMYTYAGDYKPMLPSAIKGSVRDYYPEAIKRYNISTVIGFAYSGWSGKLYLMEHDANRNIQNGMSEFYYKAINDALEYAEGYCESFFKSDNIESGYYMVDQFDIVPVADKDIARYIISGNVTCLTKN